MVHSFCKLLSELHGADVYHLDIKLDNFLITRRNRSEPVDENDFFGRLPCKITGIDLGSAQDLRMFLTPAERERVRAAERRSNT